MTTFEPGQRVSLAIDDWERGPRRFAGVVRRMVSPHSVNLKLDPGVVAQSPDERLVVVAPIDDVTALDPAQDRRTTWTRLPGRP